jgi:predicted Ser/Thr protein kinase
MSDEQTVEIVEVRQPDKLSLFQQEKALIDVQVATAKQYPRNVRRCVENAVTVATLTKEIAESCTYTVPRSKKSIVGPSVHLMI